MKDKSLIRSKESSFPRAPKPIGSRTYSYAASDLFPFVCSCGTVKVSVCLCKGVCACVPKRSPPWRVTLTAQNQHEIPQSFSADLSLA